jgi:hypothetical protein
MCSLTKANLQSGIIVLLAVMLALRVNEKIKEEQKKNFSQN